MAGSIKNNGSAWGVTTTVPAGSFKVVGWFLVTTATITENSYQTFLEVGWTGGFNRVAFDPFENNIYWAGNGYGVIAPQGTVENQWIRVMFTRDGNDWAIYWAMPDDTAWTLVTTWTTSAATTFISVFYSYADSAYLAFDGYVRSLRVYTTGTISEIFDETLLRTPTISTWAGWADLTTPVDLGTDMSGNGRNLTVTGTESQWSDDPIVGGDTVVVYNAAFFGMNF